MIFGLLVSEYLEASSFRISTPRHHQGIFADVPGNFSHGKPPGVEWGRGVDPVAKENLSIAKTLGIGKPWSIGTTEKHQKLSEPSIVGKTSHVYQDQDRQKISKLGKPWNQLIKRAW